MATEGENAGNIRTRESLWDVSRAFDNMTGGGKLQTWAIWARRFFGLAHCKCYAFIEFELVGWRS